VTGAAAVVLALMVVMAMAWLGRKPIKTAVFGLMSRDKQGRLTIALTPAKKKKSKKRKRERR
jgi:hypothetical protein